MYVVKRNGGGWDESYSIALFVTTDIELVKKYCDKANEVFQRIKLRYQEVYDEMEEKEDDVERYKLLMKWWSKLHTFHDVSEHIFENIEVR